MGSGEERERGKRVEGEGVVGKWREIERGKRMGGVEGEVDGGEGGKEHYEALTHNYKIAVVTTIHKINFVFVFF